MKLTINKQEIFLNDKLKHKLDIVKSLVKKNWDCVFCIDGREGCGKSTLALTIGWFLSNGKLLPKDICEGTRDVINKIENYKDESVLILDEGSLVFSSKDAMKREQKQLIKVLNVIRQKRMILIIVCPLFFDLVKYVAITRSRFLIHCYTKDDYVRGKFYYFTEPLKRILYFRGKKNFDSYDSPHSEFEGTFPKFEPSWYDEYLKIKNKTLMSILKEDKDKDNLLITKEMKKIMFIDFKTNYPEIFIKDLAKGFGISKMTAYRWFKEENELSSNT